MLQSSPNPSQESEEVAVDPEAVELIEKNDSFTAYVATEDRIAAERHRKAITDRNRELNEIRVLRAEENLLKYKRSSKLSDFTLQWEVDYERRQQLCVEYNLEKEGKLTEEAVVDEHKSSKGGEEENTLQRQASIHSQRRVDALSVIPESIGELFSQPCTPLGTSPHPTTASLAGSMATDFEQTESAGLPRGISFSHIALDAKAALRRLRTPTRLPPARSSSAPGSAHDNHGKRARDVSV